MNPTPVSYTHLRAHETDSYLFVGSVRMCIRDRLQVPWSYRHLVSCRSRLLFVRRQVGSPQKIYESDTCLLYTSPSPRDGLLSIRRQRQNVYKRQATSSLVLSTSCKLSISAAIRPKASRFSSKNL